MRDRQREIRQKSRREIKPLEYYTLSRISSEENIQQQQKKSKKSKKSKSTICKRTKRKKKCHGRNERPAEASQQESGRGGN